MQVMKYLSMERKVWRFRNSAEQWIKIQISLVSNTRAIAYFETNNPKTEISVLWFNSRTFQRTSIEEQNKAIVVVLFCL